MLSWFAVHASIAYLPGAVLPVPTGALSASVRPRLAARAVPAPSMGWVDDQHSFRYEKAEEEVDVSEAAERAKCLAGPSPDLQPLDVLDVVLRAFKRGTNEDIEDLFQFVLPTGQLASDYSSSAGAMSAFRWKIRKEPRWKNIAGRPHAALLHMRAYEVLGSLMTDADVRLYRVRAEPFFPDAPHAESDVIFQFELVKQRASHPAAREALGNRADCWLVNNILPHYSDWAVKDPINNSQCPDTFVMPKRSAED